MQPSDIGTLIRSRRQGKHMTQKELADQLHVTDKAVSKWERGICYPDISLLADIGKILDIALPEFFSQDGEPVHSEAQDAVRSDPEQENRDRRNEAIIINTLDYAEQMQEKSRERWRLTGFIFLMFPLFCGILLFAGLCFFLPVLDTAADPDSGFGAALLTIAMTAFLMRTWLPSMVLYGLINWYFSRYMSQGRKLLIKRIISVAAVILILAGIAAGFFYPLI